jgi:hypothetical protein
VVHDTFWHIITFHTTTVLLFLTDCHFLLSDLAQNLVISLVNYHLFFYNCNGTSGNLMAAHDFWLKHISVPVTFLLANLIAW